MVFTEYHSHLNNHILHSCHAVGSLVIRGQLPIVPLVSIIWAGSFYRYEMMYILHNSGVLVDRNFEVLFTLKSNLVRKAMNSIAQN
jgi:hypothetical protein